jgi:hypothetical protein
MLPLLRISDIRRLPADRSSVIRRVAILASAVGLLATSSPLRLLGEQPQEAIPESAPADPAIVPRPATADEIDKWIDELSHDAFTVRQSAATRLLSAGTPARDALLAVADGPDPESRAAARRLVALIDRSEFTRRLEAFAEDTDGRRGLTLPGWQQFRELVGSDSNARQLFVDMQRAEGPLLAAVFGVSARPAAQSWDERLLRLVQWQAASGNRGIVAPLGSCATMLFLGTVSEVDVSDTGAVLVEQLIQRPPIQQRLATGAAGDAIRRLVVGWLVHCPNKNESILQRRLALASAISVKEALPLPLAVIRGDTQYAGVQPTTRAAAILLVGQLGDRQHVEHLEPLLEDTTICMPLQTQVAGRPGANVQLRDVALVVALHLTGQRPADYGYLYARLQPQRTFQLDSLHCENDERRAEAVAEWRAWRAANKEREARAAPQQPTQDAADGN